MKSAVSVKGHCLGPKARLPPILLLWHGKAPTNPFSRVDSFMTSLIAIDWGSSNRRCYRLEDGILKDSRYDALGVLSCGSDFSGSLATLLALWPDLPEGAPVLMSGMIGSRSGWLEAPYLPCPARLAELGEHLRELTDKPHPLLASRRISIVPGVCQQTDPDVMRGEEMQLLGAMCLGGKDGIYVLPGTHSKWVRMQDGCISSFRSFMTGELFALLCEQGSLAAMLQADRTGDDTASFAAGLAAGKEVLSHALFALRASVLLGKQRAENSRAYLSGLLVGAEWQDAGVREWLESARDQPVTLIGEARLTALHAQAANAIGMTVTSIAPEAAFVAAAQHLWRYML